MIDMKKTKQSKVIVGSELPEVKTVKVEISLKTAKMLIEAVSSEPNFKEKFPFLDYIVVEADFRNFSRNCESLIPIKEFEWTRSYEGTVRYDFFALILNRKISKTDLIAV